MRGIRFLTRRSSNTFRVLILLAGSICLAATGQAVERNPNGYNHLIPDLTKHRPYIKAPLEASEKIIGKESIVERFKMDDKLRLGRISTNNIVWGYAFRKGFNKAYAIIDEDEDGTFESKYGPREHFYVPQWVLDKLHEMK